MIQQFMKRDDWYMWVNMKKGTVTMPVFQSLEAFYPGLQVSCVCLLQVFWLVHEEGHGIFEPMRDQVKLADLKER